MSPLFWALLFAFGLAGLITVAWIAAMDRAAARREINRRMPVIGRDVAAPLPTAIVIPTAHRQKHPETWS
jgi:hypothetical protein